jgi:uncharacterized phiE125 gp8 family phage protein
VQYRSLTRQTPPAVEPVTVAEAKAHLRVDTSDDDTYIGTLIAAGRQWCEEYLDRTLVNTQWVMRFDSFPDNGTESIELPRPPMVTTGTATAVTVTMTLATGNTSTFSTSAYRVDRFATPGEIQTVYAGTWPADRRDDQNAASVTWWAGYGSTGSSVPAAIRHAILMLVGILYEKRAAAESGSLNEVPFGVKSLLDSQRWGSYR